MKWVFLGIDPDMTVPFELLIVHLQSFSNVEYPATSHHDSETRVKAKLGQ